MASSRDPGTKRRTASAPSGPTARTGRPRGRRPSIPGRRGIVGAFLMVTLGSFMPWLDTALENVSGARGPGLWTFYAALIGLAAAIVPMRVAALVQGAVFALVAIAIPVWQLVHAYSLVGMEGWRPGPGLVLVLGGGVVAAVSTYTMYRADWPAQR